jgi:hypothetical protein
MKNNKGGIDYSEWSYDKKRLGYYNADFQLEQDFSAQKNTGLELYDKNQKSLSSYKEKDQQYDNHAYNPLTYKDYQAAYPKTNKLKKSEIITAIVLMVSGLLITILLTALLAQGLNIGHLMGKMNKAENKKADYYAVQIGSFISENEALAASNTIRQLGGGGYIVVDGSYRIIAGVYPKYEQALTVIANTTQFASSQYVITVPTVSMNFSDKSIKKAVEKSLSQWDEIYKKLYDHSILLDKGQTTDTAVLQDIKIIHDNLKTHIDDYSDLTKNQSRLEHLRIKSGMLSMLSTLNSLNTAQKEKLSSEIKYAYTKILIEYRDLAKEIA